MRVASRIRELRKLSFFRQAVHEAFGLPGRKLMEVADDVLDVILVWHLSLTHFIQYGGLAMV